MGQVWEQLSLPDRCTFCQGYVMVLCRFIQNLCQVAMLGMISHISSPSGHRWQWLKTPQMPSFRGEQAPGMSRSFCSPAVPAERVSKANTADRFLAWGN
jgi:hypothetical protein